MGSVRPHSRIFQITELQDQSIVDVHEFDLPLLFAKTIDASEINRSSSPDRSPLPTGKVLVKVSRSHFTVQPFENSQIAVRKNDTLSYLAGNQAVRGSLGDRVFLNLNGRVFFFEYASQVDSLARQPVSKLALAFVVAMLIAPLAWVTHGAAIREFAARALQSARLSTSACINCSVEDSVMPPVLDNAIKKATRERSSKQKTAKISNKSHQKRKRVASLDEIAVMPALSPNHDEIVNSFSGASEKSAAKLPVATRTTLGANTLGGGTRVSALDSALNNFDGSSQGEYVVDRPDQEVQVQRDAADAAVPSRQAKDDRYPSAWDDQVKSRLPEAQQCFGQNSGLVKNKDAEYFIDVSVMASGMIKAVKLSGDRLPDRVRDCVAGRIKRWNLKPAWKKDAQISVPIIVMRES